MDLSRIPDDIATTELIDALQQHWGIKYDADLEKELDVARGSIHQCRKGKGGDVKSKIIVSLLRDIAYLEKQLALTAGLKN